MNGFGESEAGGVEGHENGAQPEVRTRIEERRSFVRFKDLGNVFGFLGVLPDFLWEWFLQNFVEENFYGGPSLVESITSKGAFFLEGNEIVENVFGVDFFEGFRGALEKILDATDVGVNGIVSAFHDPQVVGDLVKGAVVLLGPVQVVHVVPPFRLGVIAGKEDITRCPGPG